MTFPSVERMASLQSTAQYMSSRSSGSCAGSITFPSSKQIPSCHVMERFRRDRSDTVISFLVNVPVLSVKIQVAEPSSSIAAIFRITARLRARRATEIASTVVTTAGIPSGTTAMASEIAVKKACRICEGSNMMIIPKMSTAATPAKIVRRFPNAFNSIFNAVALASCAWSKVEIFPISVCMPVAVTTARPRPNNTTVSR